MFYIRKWCYFEALGTNRAALKKERHGVRIQGVPGITHPLNYNFHNNKPADSLQV